MSSSMDKRMENGCKMMKREKAIFLPLFPGAIITSF